MSTPIASGHYGACPAGIVRDARRLGWNTSKLIHCFPGIENEVAEALINCEADLDEDGHLTWRETA